MGYTEDRGNMYINIIKKKHLFTYILYFLGVGKKLELDYMNLNINRGGDISEKPIKLNDVRKLTKHNK